MQRYLRFIDRCSQQPDGPLVERHHVCPKALFPEYSDGRKHPWNIVKLSQRQHLIAHWILWKVFCTRSVAFAFKAMLHTREDVPNVSRSSRLYERLKTESRRAGFVVSDDTRAKMSAAAHDRYARGEVMTEDGRARLSEYARNRPEEVRAKIGAKHRGKVASTELRQKRREQCAGAGNPRAQTWTVHYDDGRPPENVRSLRTWCTEQGLKYSTIYMRVRNGTAFRNGMRIEKSSE